ncbi:MAG TPA: hypothetical protein VHT75_10885 [Acidimicrobiales bacterium]|nr:hypothetical protein [Acidimicrobiales bacterium]
MVLLVLAGIWLVVIAVPLVRARTEGTLGDSIGSFRRHLSVLERAAPMTVAPANRMHLPRSQAAGVIGPYRPPSANAGRAVSGRRRQQAQKRRRDVLMGLVVAMAGSALLAMIPGLSVMWLVNVVVDVLFVGYVGLLVRMRNVAAEREMKLTFLPVARPLPVRYEGAPGTVSLDLHRRAANQ